MEFNNRQAIYMQIADLICEKILLGQFKEEERIPSVREMAVQLEVNPNTVMHTFEFLQANNIIVNKRGVGYFVAPDGKGKASALRKEEFMNTEVPQFLKTAVLLKISLEELGELYRTYQKNL